MLKIFTLKCIDPSSGNTYKATFREKLAWLLAGCPVRQRKVIDRFVEKKHRQHRQDYVVTLKNGANANSNTFSLPSS